MQLLNHLDLLFPKEVEFGQVRKDISVSVLAEVFDRMGE